MVSEQCYGLLCCSGAVGAVLVVLGGLLLGEKSKYTPLYREIVCSPTEYRLTGVSLSPVRFDLGVDIRCDNPNPYTLRGKPWGTAAVWIGSDRAEVGTSTVLAKTGGEIVLPEAEGERNGWGTFTLELSVGQSAVSSLLFGIGVTSAFEAYFELKVKIGVEPNILGLLSTTLTELTVDEKCGMMVRLLPIQTGDVNCSSTFETLGRPAPIGDITDTQFASFNIPEEEIRSGEEARDLVCDAASASCLALGLLSLAAPAAYLLSQRGGPCRGGTVREVLGDEPDPEVVGKASAGG